MYKVEYSRYAVMADGSQGNIMQGGDVAYMDTNLAAIPELLSQYLKQDDKYIAVITNISRIKGHIA